jgi:hypothetical protein
VVEPDEARDLVETMASKMLRRAQQTCDPVAYDAAEELRLLAAAPEPDLEAAKAVFLRRDWLRTPWEVRP